MKWRKKNRVISNQLQRLTTKLRTRKTTTQASRRKKSECEILKLLRKIHTIKIHARFDAIKYEMESKNKKLSRLKAYFAMCYLGNKTKCEFRVFADHTLNVSEDRVTGSRCNGSHGDLSWECERTRETVQFELASSGGEAQTLRPQNSGPETKMLWAWAIGAIPQQIYWFAIYGSEAQ